MRENQACNTCAVRDLVGETKEAWHRLCELVSWTLKNPKSQRSDRETSIVYAYKVVLYRWLLSLLVLFLLIGLVKFVWHVWGKIFDLILHLVGL